MYPPSCRLKLLTFSCGTQTVIIITSKLLLYIQWKCILITVEFSCNFAWFKKKHHVQTRCVPISPRTLNKNQYTTSLTHSKLYDLLSSIMDLFLTNMQLFTSQDVNRWTGVLWITCGLLWCFYQLFGLSFWRHPFTAEDPLVSEWSVPMKKQTPLNLGWPEGE